MKRSHYFNQHLYLAERMASFFTRKFSGLNITYDDLYQEALQGLLEASKIYEDNSRASFSTFSHIIIKRRILKYLRKYSANKELINNNSLEYNDAIYSSSNDPKDLVLSKELYRYITEFKHSLSMEESSIFELRNNGFNNNEIATLLEVDPRKITKVYSKARQDLIAYLKSL